MALDKITTPMITDDAVTAAKIPAGAIGTTEIAEGALSVHALQNTTSHTLSGTYTDSKMYTSDAYVLGGDITVNSNLVLSSVKGDDSDITLTDDGTTRTITGTGKLEAGAILTKERSDLTGMTGELGSVVTGASAITGLGTVTSGTLGSEVNFPAGHVVNTTFKGCSATLHLNQANEIFCAKHDGIENLAVTAGNKLAIWFIGGNIYTSTNSPYYSAMQIRVADNGSDTDYQTTVQGHVGADARFDPVSCFAFHTCVGTSVNIMYGIWGYTSNSSTNYYLTPTHYTAGQSGGMRFCVQEIQT